ncbi:uncharacterized protein UTRI_01238 [Ustilago trichophora]|uniref:Uncharacterized protein n=1 Tax=Ustilago trichophora TaxID=86804 RepID=A0A5C3DXZ5_9BASI|nr:uncharacterized protein UTRI_01238 [Ustilago trichophora]
MVYNTTPWRWARTAVTAIHAVTGYPSFAAASFSQRSLHLCGSLLVVLHVAHGPSFTRFIVCARQWDADVGAKQIASPSHLDCSKKGDRFVSAASQGPRGDKSQNFNRNPAQPEAKNLKLPETPTVLYSTVL